MPLFGENATRAGEPPRLPQQLAGGSRIIADRRYSPIIIQRGWDFYLVGNACTTGHMQHTAGEGAFVNGQLNGAPHIDIRKEWVGVIEIKVLVGGGRRFQ